MNITLKKFEDTNLSFIEEMLYEAVFWRKGPAVPSFEEGLAMPELKKALEDFGKRSGDIAVTAYLDDLTPVGAAWLRYWKEEDQVRGFIAENIPVLVIAVKKTFRHQGTASKLIDWLVRYSAKQSIQQLSLCVSKDNLALDLYKKMGFSIYSDLEHSFNMLRKIL